MKYVRRLRRPKNEPTTGICSDCGEEKRLLTKGKCFDCTVKEAKKAEGHWVGWIIAADFTAAAILPVRGMHGHRPKRL